MRESIAVRGPSPKGGRAPVRPSTGQLNVSLGSNISMRGHIITPDNRVMIYHSRTEHDAIMAHMYRPETRDLREQVKFEWHDEAGEVRSHYFDFVQHTTDGRKLAYMVKAAARVRGSFAEKAPIIACQAIDRGGYDDVRLLTEKDIDPVELANAMLIHGSRRPDPVPDEAAARAVDMLEAAVTVGELVLRIGHHGMGFRAIVRLIGRGVLRLRDDERVTYASVVFRT